MLEHSNSCQLLHKINQAVLLRYVQLKNNYLRTPPPNQDIIRTLKV